jgi:hypothetical protein
LGGTINTSQQHNQEKDHIMLRNYGINFMKILILICAIFSYTACAHNNRYFKNHVTNLDHKLIEWADKTALRQNIPTDHNDVIIFGYGRFGGIRNGLFTIDLKSKSMKNYKNGKTEIINDTKFQALIEAIDVNKIKESLGKRTLIITCDGSWIPIQINVNNERLTILYDHSSKEKDNVDILIECLDSITGDSEYFSSY